MAGSRSRVWRGAGLVGLVVLALILAAGVGEAAARPGPVWLCKPGLANNPCAPSLKTTLVSPVGQVLGVKSPKRVKRPEVDCFYVYPTVSVQKTKFANLHIDPEQRSVALYQAARYSQYCRVFAPMYRQVTVAGLGFGSGTKVPARDWAKAYPDVRSAWRTYLAKYNRGRGVVFIGHSQGSLMLRTLIGEEIDQKPAIRRRLVSAILLGGNVEVRKGRKIGGDFDHIPACRSAAQTGCAVAFSTFNAPVPADAAFGRVGGALSYGDPDKLDILCTNPAALGGGSGKLDTVFPTAPPLAGATLGLFSFPIPTIRAATAWYEYKGAYRGTCSGADGAHVLQISALGGAPTLPAIPDPTWGLHLTEGNIALGNLVDMVRRQIPAYLRGNR